ncbi:MAG: succinate dehydrogenase, cytochrome b556 subunit [Pseudomonadales bacterium]|nr:succinate dehydrogenase, cytochrome b556 subunit [Pseudomonadales bacterium]
MKTERPVNIFLLRFAWPFAAIASILHRISGGVLFVGVVFLLYIADLALGSEPGFEEAQVLLATPLGKFILFGLMAALLYHLVAGTKHLLLDFHVADTLEGARLASQLTVGISIVLIALAGIWIW